MSARHRHVKRRIRGLERRIEELAELLGSYERCIQDLMGADQGELGLMLGLRQREVMQLCVDAGSALNIEKETLAAMPKRLGDDCG